MPTLRVCTADCFGATWMLQDEWVLGDCGVNDSRRGNCTSQPAVSSSSAHVGLNCGHFSRVFAVPFHGDRRALLRQVV
jgi:hypothetical protein